MEIRDTTGRVAAHSLPSFQHRTGRDFATAPIAPDNATKQLHQVIQRIPVKIVIDARAMTGANCVMGIGRRIGAAMTLPLRRSPSNEERSLLLVPALRSLAAPKPQNYPHLGPPCPAE